MRPALTSFLVLAVSLSAQDGWNRIGFSGKGAFSAPSLPHPLSYFTDNPLLRDDGDELCTDCSTLASKGASKGRGSASLTSKLSAVGTLAGFRIWDLFYHGIYNGGRVVWKSVLIQSGPDRYTEIFHLQASGPVDHLSPSSIVHAGNESLLATNDPDGGNGGGCWEAYWWFDKSGPHLVDFSVLAPVIARNLPPGARFSTRCSEVHIEDQEIISWVQDRSAQCRACGRLGEVTAHFHLHGANAEPLKVNFVPDAH